MTNDQDDKCVQESLTNPLREELKCRRRDYVQAAYVDASRTIKDRYGLRRAENILRTADVPMAVIARVLLAGGPYRLRRMSKRPPNDPE